MFEFRLLGPVVVERDGEPVGLRRPLELALLARLALDPGRTVGAERLIDDLWGERAPVNPMASLRTLVYRLRKNLGPGDDLVIWNSRGYNLAVDSDQVDVDEFERIVSRARAGSGESPPAETRLLLRRALELWRGPALGGLESFPFATTHARRLTAARLAVLEECFAADLDAGEHVAVVPELERTVAEFPFEEQFWAQLMTALYRSGSQGAALRACARLRKLLAGELGIEPMPMVRDLEHAILTQRPDLDWRPTVVRSGPPPTATMTFLFVAVVDSREIWERHPAQMGTAMARTNEILHTVSDRYKGRALSTVGDQFALVFDRALDGLMAAIESQQALGAADWEQEDQIMFRMGLHVGEAEERSGGYYGQVVNVAKRVMLAGHGGQILVSASLAAAAPEVDLIDLGEFHLAGIGSPQRLHQVSAPGLRRDFELPRSVPAGSNLPFSTDPFVGRSVELEEIDRLMREHRLVSLVGPGGSGKTRLAIEAARAQVNDYPDGVWFVDLTVVTDEAGTVRAFSSALGVSLAARPLIQQLAEGLLTRRLLLVVDNCEHILGVANGVVMTLLHRVRGLRVLATTREPLGVAGEAVVQVGALSLASDDDPHRVRDSDAVQLFLSRGRAACPDFVGRDEDLVHVAEICRLVDGLPLAIELAAARLRAVSVPELAARLGDRLAFLGTRPSQEGDRHHSMEAVVDWSYRLLEDGGRVLLRRLAVFARGFTIASAENVCSWGVLEPPTVVDLLVGLVDKSLVQKLDLPSGPRYRLLDTIHDFATRRLAESDEHDSARDRHLAWAVEVTGTLEAAIRTRAQEGALAAAVVEHDNLRVARTWALERNDVVSALRITTAAPIDSASDRGRLLARLSEDAPHAPLSVRACAYYTCISVAFDCGDYERGALHGQLAISLFHELGDTRQEGYARMMYAFCGWGLGHADVGDQLAEAAALFDEDDDTMGRAYIAWTLAQWLVEHGNNLQLAETLAEQGVELFADIGAEFGLAHAREGLALIRLLKGETHQAMGLILEAMVAFQSAAHLGCLAHAVDVAAVCVAEVGDLDSSAMLVGAAESLFARAGGARRPWEQAAYSRLRRRLASEMAPDLYDRARRLGRDMTADLAVDTLHQLILRS